jgi:hypothetical protein
VYVFVGVRVNVRVAVKVTVRVGVDTVPHVGWVTAASQDCTAAPWQVVATKLVKFDNRHGGACVLKSHAIALYA